MDLHLKIIFETAMNFLTRDWCFDKLRADNTDSRSAVMIGIELEFSQLS